MASAYQRSGKRQRMMSRSQPRTEPPVTRVTMAAAAAGAKTPTKNGRAAALSSPPIIAGVISVHDMAKARTKNAAVGWATMRAWKVLVMPQGWLGTSETSSGLSRYLHAGKYGTADAVSMTGGVAPAVPTTLARANSQAPASVRSAPASVLPLWKRRTSRASAFPCCGGWVSGLRSPFCTGRPMSSLRPRDEHRL
jgi:hypothetical protein